MYNKKWEKIHKMENLALFWSAWIVLAAALKVMDAITLKQFVACLIAYGTLAVSTVTIRLIMQYT